MVEKIRLKKLYTVGGPYEKGSWKEGTDEIITPGVIRRIYHSMKEKGYIPPDEKDFVFVSPTANTPTHETTFFEEDQKTRKGTNKFLVGDISEFPLKSTDISRRTDNGIFQYFRWDAELLPIKDGTVDLLWDRKGWLWHSAKDGGAKTLLSTLHQYRDLLKDNGVIVIDNIIGLQSALPRMPAKTILKAVLADILSAARVKRMRPSHIFKGVKMDQYEGSTIEMIHMRDRVSGGEILKYIHEYFEIHAFGSGVCRVLVLKKKAR